MPESTAFPLPLESEFQKRNMDIDEAHGRVQPPRVVHSVEKGDVSSSTTMVARQQRQGLPSVQADDGKRGVCSRKP